MLAALKGTPNASSPGFYILFGRDESDEDTVYVGKSEDIQRRLVQHAGSKDFWEEAIAFVSKDDHLNAGHIGWLEANAYQIIREAGQVNVANDSAPSVPSLSASVKDTANEFLHNSAFLLSAMGRKVMESTAERVQKAVSTGEDSGSLTFSIRLPKRGIQATGIQVNSGFIVMSGSVINSELVPSTPKSAINKLSQMKENGALKEIGPDQFELTVPIEFNSPSGASSFVMFRRSHGRDEWKLPDGRTLAQFENGEIEKASEPDVNLFSEIQED